MPTLCAISVPVPSADTRPEYARLLHDLEALTGCFGVTLPWRAQCDAAAFTFCIECADRLLDAIPDRAGREQLGETILSSLRGVDDAVKNVNPELAHRLAQLEEIADRCEVRTPVCTVVTELLRNCEVMRSTRWLSEFADCAAREGRLMVELLLLLIGEWTTPEFDGFMRAIAAPANLIDKLRDASFDFQRGEIAIRPTLIFQAALGSQLLWRTVRLLPFCFGNWRLTRWGGRAFFSELVGFPKPPKLNHSAPTLFVPGLG